MFQVRLKCVNDFSSSPSRVFLFLLEPKTCEYILGVESSLICNILEYADEDGLISDAALINIDNLKTSSSQTSIPNKKDQSEEKKNLNDEL